MNCCKKQAIEGQIEGREVDVEDVSSYWITLKKRKDAVFYVVSTVYHSIELFHLPASMHNSLFINNISVTLISSTCFEH